MFSLLLFSRRALCASRCLLVLMISQAQAQAIYVVGRALIRLRLRLVTSQGSPYPSRSPRAHPSGWSRMRLRLRLVTSQGSPYPSDDY